MLQKSDGRKVKKIILLYYVIASLASGCATYSESQREEAYDYFEIKALIAKNYFYDAENKMFEFEKKYPESQFLCEFYSFQIVHGLNSNKKNYETLFGQKCEGKK